MRLVVGQKVINPDISSDYIGTIEEIDGPFVTVNWNVAGISGGYSEKKSICLPEDLVIVNKNKKD
jgi:hypothetical protein